MATVGGSPSGLAKLSTLLGSPEPALRLLCSILLGFPLALIHRYTLYGKSLVLQYTFFIASGIFLGYWNYGWNILHLAVTLVVTYLILKVCGGTKTSVFMTFVFNMMYLLHGYYMTSTEDYDIKWTMPQCVTTLRLIGLAFDVLDGRKEEEELSAKQKETALKSVPSLLEMAAYTYFPGSFLVGPQFSMRRFLDYVNGQHNQSDSCSGTTELPDCLIASFQRVGIAFFYIIVFQIGSTYVSDQYFLSTDFKNQYFLKSCFLLGLWGRITMYKYIICWLVAEAVCIAFGLTYNGKDEQGRPKWDGCANVKLKIFENATQFNHYILSFNINTNNWCAEYIYKRLRFLRSKIYSQLLTLIFIAIWHGLHSGYYVCFFMEFIVIYFEKDVGSLLRGNDKLQNLLKNPFLAVTVWILLKIYTFVFMGYSLIPFVFLSFHKYMLVFANFYYMGHVFFLSYVFLAPLIKPFIRQKRPKPREE